MRIVREGILRACSKISAGIRGAKIQEPDQKDFSKRDPESIMPEPKHQQRADIYGASAPGVHG